MNGCVIYDIITEKLMHFSETNIDSTILITNENVKWVLGKLYNIPKDSQCRVANDMIEFGYLKRNNQRWLTIMRPVQYQYSMELILKKR